MRAEPEAVRGVAGSKSEILGRALHTAESGGGVTFDIIPYLYKADGEFEARLVALSCREPPEQHSRWSLRLLADRAVQHDYIDGVSHETVRRVLKKTRTRLSGGGTSARRGYKRPNVATARKLLGTLFAVLREAKPYRDPETDYQARLVKRNALQWEADPPAPRSTSNPARRQDPRALRLSEACAASPWNGSLAGPSMGPPERLSRTDCVVSITIPPRYVAREGALSA